MGLFGNDWKPGQATIVAKARKNTKGTQLGPWEFVADIDCPGAEPFRVTLHEPRIAIDFWPPDVGDVVAVLADPSEREAKFDKDDEQISLKARRRASRDAFEETAAREPGAPIELVPGSKVVSASPEMLKGLLSADPATKAAAMDALRAVAQSAGRTMSMAGAGADGDVAARLEKLDALKAGGLISAEEHAAQRQRILDDI